MEKDSGKYYELLCLYCDKPLTNLISNTSYIRCPHCGHTFSMYQVFSYNMWLSENHKANKLSNKPAIFRELPIFKNEENEPDDGSFKLYEDIINQLQEDIEGIEDDEEEELDIEEIHNLCFNTAAIAMIQFNYLKRAGFSENQAFIILQKIIESGFRRF